MKSLPQSTPSLAQQHLWLPPNGNMLSVDKYTTVCFSCVLVPVLDEWHVRVRVHACCLLMCAYDLRIGAIKGVAILDSFWLLRIHMCACVLVVLVFVNVNFHNCGNTCCRRRRRRQRRGSARACACACCRRCAHLIHGRWRQKGSGDIGQFLVTGIYKCHLTGII